MPQLTKARIAVATLAALLLGACGGEPANDQAAQTASPDATPEASPCLVEGASTQTRTSDVEPPMSPVTDVRYNTGDCPRIVFEFQDQISGYEIGYAEPPFSECGSGEDVSTDAWEADGFLSVRLEPSASVDLTNEAEPTYEGPRDIDADGDVLKHLRVICDFEGIFQWIVGLEEERPFNVVTFDDPPRIMIDIAGESA